MAIALDLRLPEGAVEPPPPAIGTLHPRAFDADADIRTSLELISELYHYNHWIFDRVRAFVRGRICEVGCGIGTITQFLLNHERIVGIEPSANSSEAARARFATHLNVDITRCFLSDCPCERVPAAFFDTLLCLNVLEHIEDDIAALSQMRQLCAPNGRVVILVPAHMTLYGQLDRSFGHYRRYNKHSMRRAFGEAGLDVTHTSYMNSLGYLGWLWQSRIRRRRQIPVSGARLFNRLVPFLDAIERLFPLPFGQSLLTVGTPVR